MQVTTIKDLGAQGGVMKQFAKFMEHASVDNFEALECMLEVFNGPESEDFEGDVMEGLVRFIASRSGGKAADKKYLAENLGYDFQRAAKRLFKECSVPQIELVTRFLSRIQDEERQERDPLAVMREIACSTTPPEGYPYPGYLAKHLLWLHRKFERGYILTYADADGATKTMNLSRSEAAQAAKLMEPIMKGVKSWEEEEVEIESGKAPSSDRAEPAASPANLSDSLDVAEPKDAEEAVSIPETDWLEKKYRELKAEESDTRPATPTLFVGNICSIDLTEEEFYQVIEAVRKIRDGYELLPDPVLADEAVAAMKKACESVKLRQKEAQPQE